MRTPPPPAAKIGLGFCPSPFAIVIPERVTLLGPVVSMSKILKRGAPALRTTLNKLAPGPLIVRLLPIDNLLVVRLILVMPGAKFIVSPDTAVWGGRRRRHTPPPHN